MDFKKLRNLADKNEVRIDNHRGHKRSPPHYYLLQETFLFYFQTFISKNESYDFYASATSTDKRKAMEILERQFLDIENTVFCLISFERFFELFIKDFLKETHIHLIHQLNNRSYQRPNRAPRNTFEIIEAIRSDNFIAFKDDRNRYLTIPFREARKRFYELIAYSKDPTKKTDYYVKKFSEKISAFPFLADANVEANFEFINWYRDRILHLGNKLPRMRFLDFIITQRVIPLINQILKSDTRIPVEWKYFTETVGGFKILEEMEKVKFEVRNLKSIKKINETFYSLLYLAHLKELGRANLNMNHAVRNNRAINEYNYRDSKGRGKRFATIEQSNFPESQIMKCPCCNEEALVRYQEKLENYWGSGKTLLIQWVKCYTCDYHIRNNVFDLNLFNNQFEKIFDY